MKLLSVLKNIIIEQENRIDLGSFNVDGEQFNVVGTIHTQIATRSSYSGRRNPEDIADLIFEFPEVFAEVSKEVIQDKTKTSILVKALLNRYDFILGPKKERNGEYSLNIVTSILYPKKLGYKPENRLIIIKQDGDVIVEGDFNLNTFNKKTKNNLTIYF